MNKLRNRLKLPLSNPAHSSSVCMALAALLIGSSYVQAEESSIPQSLREPVRIQDTFNIEGAQERAETPTVTLDPAMQQLVDMGWVAADKAHLKTHKYCFCGGHFEEPELDLPDSDLKSSEAPLHLEADESNYVIGENTVVFTGDVKGSQGSLQVEGDKLTYYRDTQDLLIEGNIRLREPGTVIVGQETRINRITREASFDQANYLIYDSGANGQASDIKRSTEDVVMMSDASYTMCLPDNKTWEIRAKEISLDSANNEGIAKDARLLIKGVPILYIPYFNFPVNDTRKSGFLFPSVSSGSDASFDVSVPYYLNLAPNYDATIIPRFVAGHGAMLEAEGRHLSRRNNTVLSAAYLPSDERDDGQDKSRWLFAAKHNGYVDDKRALTYYVDFQRVSDRDYIQDLASSGLDIRRESQLKSSAAVKYQAQKWDASASYEAYQPLENSDKTEDLPKLSFNYFDAYVNNVFSQFEAEYTASESAHRFFYAPSIGFIKSAPQGTIEAQTGFKHVHYENKGNSNFTDKDSLVPNFKIGATANFDKTLKNNRRQTLQPRIQYYYAETKQQNDTPIIDTDERTDSYHQFFNEERFTGHDRISDANRITVGVSTQIYNAMNRQLVDAGIAQQFHLTDREVTHLDLNSLSPAARQVEEERLKARHSDIAAYVNFNPSNKLQFNTEYLISPSEGNLNSASVHLHYTPNEDKYEIYNLGYQFKRNANTFKGNPNLEDDLHQVSAAAVVNVKDNINAIAVANYDLSNHQMREQVLGVEYNSCCWRARLAYHKEEKVERNPQSSNIEHDHAVRLELQLKGLSGISSGVTDVLEETIEGFDVRENNFQ